jgi:hypothetical protein
VIAVGCSMSRPDPRGETIPSRVVGVCGRSRTTESSANPLPTPTRHVERLTWPIGGLILADNAPLAAPPRASLVGAAVIRAVREFSASHPPFDDLTLISFGRT